jgi:hypothetical protein
VKLGKLAGFLGAFLFGAIFLVSLRSTFESADWTQKPDEAALRRASAALTLPPDAVGEPLDVFSKGTFKRFTDGTAIFAATYWDSDRSTDLYCRL